MLRNIDPVHAIITYLGLLVALTMHEAAVALAARWKGDRSLETMSRATINPIPHIDFFGTVLFPLLMLFSGIPFLFGWAKPLNFDTRYFKKLKRDINIVCIIGMASCFAIAAVCGLLIGFMGYLPSELVSGKDPAPRILYSIAMGNIFIGMFNVLPFPGRDMWRLITNSVSYPVSQKLNESANIISIVLLLVLIFGLLNPVFMAVRGVFHLLFIGAL